MTKEKALRICDALEKLYPDAKPALEFATPYELLVAVVLSAQCTDERVNKVTQKLFAVADTPEKMLGLGQSERSLPVLYGVGIRNAKNRLFYLLAAL